MTQAPRGEHSEKPDVFANEIYRDKHTLVIEPNDARNIDRIIDPNDATIGMGTGRDDLVCFICWTAPAAEQPASQTEH